MRTLFLALPVALLACDRKGADMLPQAVGNHPDVLEIGKLSVMSPEQYEAYLSAEDPIAYCANELDADGNPLCYYGQMGPAPAGKRGGATYTFVIPSTIPGTTDPIGEICILVDPETVFWNAAIAREDRDDKYGFPDFPNDDGDIDLFAGMSSYYTGSPGVQLGDFKGFYTDSLGRTLEIEYGECFQSGARIGFNTAHPGRAAPEFCTVDVEGRGGIPFTAVLDTFSVPLEDGALSFGTMVVAGSCRSLSINECSVRGEALDPMVNEPVDSSGVKTCTTQLEAAACGERLQEFCCLHPSMCWDEKAPDDACESFLDQYDPGRSGAAWDNFCGETNDGGDKVNEAFCCEEMRG